LSEFFARYVNGTEDLPLAELLRDFAVTMNVRASQGIKDRGGKPGKGTPPRCTLGIRLNADQKLTAVLRDGPASRAGLSANDTLVAVGGLKALPEAMAALLARHVPGDTIEVHAFRRDELMTFRVSLGEPADDTAYLRLDPTPPADAEARRNAWLRG
jgi:predicted metalloprotease with PDZ domain